uniref:Remorin C-terminal domain-containing protein n=1 Tax=Aegilops tauschii TaxID=37682 RepID=M8CS93_AEGTA
MDTDLETDGLAATSSSSGEHTAHSSQLVFLPAFLLELHFTALLSEFAFSEASAAFTEPHDDDEAQCGLKGEWQEPAKSPAGGATAIRECQSQRRCRTEAVYLHGNNTRRYPGSSMAFPLNNRRTLPSKWEDAERWIFSPKSNSGDAREKTAALPHARRPKAKSGPLGPPGRLGGQYSSVSSSVSLFDSGRVGHLAANSPFLAGVLIPEHYGGAKSNVGRYTSGTAGAEFGIGIVGRSSLADIGSPATQSTTVRRRLDTAVESSASLPSTQESVQDEEAEFVEDSAPTVTPITSRKDTATQTSPDLSRSSSPSARPSFVRSFSMQQAKERESCFSDLEIRDVQMDERVSLTRWSKKHVTQGSNKNSTNMLEWNKRTVDSKSSSWESSETKCTIKVEREEAKLTAWENLQKAKAEAAIQKLVMKLEKKRSFSLDRILNTLRYLEPQALQQGGPSEVQTETRECRKFRQSSISFTPVAFSEEYAAAAAAA